MTRRPLTDMVGTSRRLRRKHAAHALARFADADPAGYEALLDALARLERVADAYDIDPAALLTAAGALEDAAP